jgi:hypothetical protein
MTDGPTVVRLAVALGPVPDGGACHTSLDAAAWDAATCAARGAAAAEAAGSCAGGGTGTPAAWAPDVAHPLAFLGITDAEACSIYSIHCDGSARLVTRGLAGCAPCGAFRDAAWWPVAQQQQQPVPAATPMPSKAPSPALGTPTPSATPAGGVDAGSSPTHTPPPVAALDPEAVAAGWPFSAPTTLPPVLQGALLMAGVVVGAAAVLAVGRIRRRRSGRVPARATGVADLPHVVA